MPCLPLHVELAEFNDGHSYSISKMDAARKILGAPSFRELEAQEAEAAGTAVKVKELSKEGRDNVKLIVSTLSRENWFSGMSS